MPDFYGVQLSGKIIVPNKNGTPPQEWPLWLGAGFNDPRFPPAGSGSLPYALTDLAFVQEITVQIGLALNSKVTLTLTPPLEEALEIIHSPLINWGGSLLEVQIGYST